MGYGQCEEMAFDDQGRMLNPRFGPYWIYRADEMPQMGVIFIETYEPSGPFGAKAVAEIPLDGVGPALANAVYDAVGVRILDAPMLPEKIWRALQAKKQA
jgi:putative selenate reductase molybdopterin-binding subunit